MKTKNIHAVAMGRLGGLAGTGEKKARSREHVMKAVASRLANRIITPYAVKVNGKRTPTWITYVSMKGRCGLHSNASYKYYGAKGIKVCDRWMSFKNFVDDMGVRPQGMQLDRVNNELGYFKDNCRWVSRKSNTRHRTNNRMLEYAGVTKSLAQWAEDCGLTWACLSSRLKLGWTLHEALTTAQMGNGRFVKGHKN